MKEQWERTRILIGEEAAERLERARVAVFGIGGVGGHAVEALARAGVGHLLLVDADTVSETNLNRQIVALRSTVGKPKVEVMRARIADIDPDCQVETRQLFYLPENAGEIDLSGFDYAADCVDTVTAKLEIIARAKAAGVPVISAMGTGNKLDPSGFTVADISETSICPLARVMRRELKKRGISGVKVVYSREEARQSGPAADASPFRRSTPGSISFVPSAAGLILAGAIVRDLTGL